MEFQQDSLQAAIAKMDGKLDLIVAQGSKLTVLELNHQQHKETFSRAFERIESLEASNKSLAESVAVKVANITESINVAKGSAGMFKYLVGAFGSAVIGLIVYAIQSVPK